MGLPERSKQLAALVSVVLLTLGLSTQGSVAVPAPHEAASATAVPHVDDKRQVSDRRVVAISLDGLNPLAIQRLGARGVPNLIRLYGQGAGTLNARTQVEQTVTLPNHTSMVTGRRIHIVPGGHGVYWNRRIPGITVQMAARHPVSSVFEVVHQAGGSTSLFSTKTKFSLFTRSWPGSIDRTVIAPENDIGLTAVFRQDLLDHNRAFAFLHLGLADQIGHHYKWMSRTYLRAVQRLDALVGSVMNMISTIPRLRTTVLIVTSDHGGTYATTSHSDANRFDNYRIPFVVWGAGVSHADLYALSPSFRNPVYARPGFTGKQPIRNGDLANLSTDILGLGPVPGSLWNTRQQLNWHR